MVRIKFPELPITQSAQFAVAFWFLKHRLVRPTEYLDVANASRIPDAAGFLGEGAERMEF